MRHFKIELDSATSFYLQAQDLSYNVWTKEFLVWTVQEIDHALYVCCSELVYAWFKTDLVFILLILSKQQSMYADYATKQFR